MSDGDEDLPDVTARDAIGVAQRALAKANRVDDLEARVDDLETELTKTQLRLSEYDDDRSYDQLTRDDKIGILREHAFEKAVSGTGRAKLDYDDVQWGVFDGDPSADHCYKLMRLAAEETRGFEYREDERPKALLANAAEAKKSRVFSSAKNFASGGGST